MAAKRTPRLLASGLVSTLAAAPERAGQERPAAARPPTPRRPAAGDLAWPAGVAALVALAFLSSGSSDQTVTAPGTWSEIAITLLGAAACALVLLRGGRGAAWGLHSIALFAAFTAFAGLSIVWSVQPDWSWFGANQLVSYLAAFAGAAALARWRPERWTGLIGAVAVAMTALSAWSLLAKVFPATLAATNTYGRLQAPFGYWNAVGLSAALGLPACLWWAGRRDRSWLIRGLSAPAIALLISVIVLSYSRSAALVAVIGGGLWLALVPLRLRSLPMLALGGIASVVISAWALARPALTTDGIPLAAQDRAGHSFGWVLLLVLALVTVAGLGTAWAGERISVSAVVRRRVGAAVLVVVALLPVVAVVALAESSRGLTGEISHAWSELTSPTSTVGDTSSRLTQLGSSRPLYWHQGLQVGEHALLKGAGELGYGVARLRYTTDPAKSDDAHSYLVQTFADLGLIGLGLTIALFIAWVRAAVRPLAPRVRWGALDARFATEREGLVALAAIVLAFGIQSALDWTWYFPGVTIPALLCAGWLAGRGPLLAPIGRGTALGRLRDRPGTGAAITLLAAVALICAWLMWLPLRSAQDLSAAQSAASTSAAFTDGRAAASADPLAVPPLVQLSALYQSVSDESAGRAELTHATQVQPDDPDPWQWLAQFDLHRGAIRAARFDADRVLALDHTQDYDTEQAEAVLVQAAQRTAQVAQRRARASSRRRHRGGPPAPRTSISSK